MSPFDIASVSICAGETTANLNPDPAGVDSFSWGGEQSYCLLNDTPIPYSHYNVLCPLTAGTNAPGASGFALIRATWGSLPLSGAALDFPVAGHLTIHAQGLPASTTLTYAADGTDLGSATTDAAGKLNVFASQGQNGTLPSSLDIYSVKTVTVHDALGNVLVSAGL